MCFYDVLIIYICHRHPQTPSSSTHLRSLPTVCVPFCVIKNILIPLVLSLCTWVWGHPPGHGKHASATSSNDNDSPSYVHHSRGGRKNVRTGRYGRDMWNADCWTWQSWCKCHLSVNVLICTGLAQKQVTKCQHVWKRNPKTSALAVTVLAVVNYGGKEINSPIVC